MDPSSHESSRRLPSGWTEHVGPQGQTYYHDAQNGKSTYYRPRYAVQSSIAGPPRVKQKIVKKERIPNTDGWIRVTTNRDNVFYAHVPSKTSLWLPPDEIRAQVDRMTKEAERLQREQKVQEERRMAEARKMQAEEAKRKKEQDRRARQAEAERKNEERRAILQKREADGQGERDAVTTKRVKESHGDDEDDDDDEAERAWQRSIAAEMAADVVATDSGKSPKKVSLSPEEAKEVFMHMLTSFNGTSSEINPMMPWDREVRKFAEHRDYDVLPSLKDREDVFNEWCKVRIREKRGTGQVKASTSSNESQSSSQAYRTLLEKEVLSTRTEWEDFRKTWKRDVRFYRFGRDDREREKVFKSWLVELGEKKRKAAEAAECAFRCLLDERLDRSNFQDFDTQPIDRQQTTWTSTKRNLDKDPRYDAVGSSSKRFELFKDWVKRLPLRTNGTDGTKQHDNVPSVRMDSRDASDALRRREDEVRKQRRRAELEKGRTSGLAIKEESRLAFQQLLIDSIHDPLATLPYAFDAITADSRFSNAGLSDAEREDLFFDHMDRLNERRLKALELIFAKHAPTLDVDEQEALPLILDDDDVSRRNLTKLRSVVNGRKELRDLFADWNAKRFDEARQAFRQMLKENAFVDFWGRLRQEYERRKNGDQSQRIDDEEEADDTPDLFQMAAHIDLDEIHAVLQRDPRYRAFDHAPAKRSHWIREYLQTMQIPKKTVFQK